MTERRDPDRLIHHFLHEGSEQLHDQVYDAVRAEIEQQRQRAVIGPWRVPDMNRLVPVGIGVAAVAVVLIIGIQMLRPPASGGVGGAPSAEPSASLSTTREPSAAAPSPSAGAGLPVGSSHVLIDEAGVRGTVTVLAAGWSGDGGVMAKNDNVDPPGGAGMIAFTGAQYVYGDPCEWSTTKPATPAETVAELVAALSAQASREASAPVDITVGSYSGQSITLHVPDDAVFSQCDQGYFGSWGNDVEATPVRYHQGPGQIDHLWILDVGGVLTIIDTAYYAGTPAEDVEELQAIVASASFE